MGMLLPRNQEKSSLKDILHNILFIIPIAYLMVTSIAYFYANISDINKATEGAYPALAVLLYLLQYLAFAMQKRKADFIINNLEYIVNLSWFRIFNFLKIINYFLVKHFIIIAIVQGKDNIVFESYQKIEEKAKNFTRKFTKTMCGMVSGVFILPLAVVGYSYAVGAYSPDVWFLPYKVV